MKRTQIQFPDPLYQRLKEVSAQNDWTLADVVRRAVELYLQRFPNEPDRSRAWVFPTVDAGGDFLVDPSEVKPEAEAIERRTRR